MKLIMIGLLPMVVLSFLTVIFGSEWIDIIIGQYDLSHENIQYYNDLAEFMGHEGLTGQATFSIDVLTGAIAIIVGIIALATLLGIQILGSGLSDTSVRLISILSAYIGLWSVLSVLCIPLIIEIEIFGQLIYIGLTLAYTIGVIEKISES